MAEEYIIKSKDSIEVIPKEQWDGSKNNETFLFIPLGEGTDKDLIEENGKIEDIRRYKVTFGLIFMINREKDSGYFFYLYKDKNGKYSGEWVRMVRGALMYEAKKYLLEEKTWAAINSAVNTIIDPEALVEFKKIVESIALGNVFYDYLEDRGIEVDIDELNTKRYFYKIYKYALKGKLDFDRYTSIVGLEYSDDWAILDINVVESIQIRVEMAYEKIENNN